MSRLVRPPMGRFSMIPSAAFIDRRLTSQARDILAIISLHGNTKSGGWCFVYQRNIGEILGIGREIVNRWVHKLTDYGYLDKKPSYLKSGARSYNWYRVNLNYELPEEFSRLPLAPDEEPVDEDPPVIVGSHPLCPQDHTPVILRSHPCDRRITPINKDEKGESNGEISTSPSPFFVQEADAEAEALAESPTAWARRVEWHQGLPRLSRALAAAGVTRKAAARVMARDWLEQGMMPPFSVWEDCHFWPTTAYQLDSERMYEYGRFITVCLAHQIAITEQAPTAIPLPM